MGEPTYFDGPDYPDGTDAEGFPGGDQRFGLIKPTKEEVEEKLKRWDIIRKDNPEEEFKCWYEAIQEAWQAYLAQAQELEAQFNVNKDLNRELHEARKRIVDVESQRDRYIADNQAKAQELGRKDKLIKMQDGFIMEKSKDAAERLQVINRLEDDNQALRKQIIHFEVRKGEPLRYVTDDMTGECETEGQP